MLPLSKPDAEILDRFSKKGYDKDRIVVSLFLDLDLSDAFAKNWLFIYKTDDALSLIRFEEKDFAVTEWDIAALSEPYIDNFATSCRLLVHSTNDSKKDSPTIQIGGCTNSCKAKLVAFLQVWERTARGEDLSEDDPLFEQFNAKCPRCGKPYKDQNRRICEHCTKKKHMITRVLTYFIPFKWQFFTVLLCLVASSAISLASPIISGQLLFDQVISKPTYNAAGEIVTGKYHSMSAVIAVVGLIFLLAVVGLAISIVQSRATAEMSNRVTATMRKDVFNALQGLSMSYFNHNPTGRLMSRVNQDAMRIRQFFTDGVPHFIINSLNFIGLSIFLFIINWKLTLIIFIPVPIIVLIFRKMLPKLWHMHSIGWRRSSSLNTMMSDSLTGIRVVKVFAKEGDENARFEKYASRLTTVNLATNLISLTIFPVVGVLIGLSSQAIWGFGGLEVMGGHMTYGELTTYLGYTGMIFGPLNFFSNFTNQVTDTSNAATRMFETLDTVPDIQEVAQPTRLPTIADGVVFDRVHFSYNPNRQILKDLSFRINAGDHIGIVGHTGSGKSTIANLIMRMYDVNSGSISIDGTNIKQIKISDLRRNIAIVSQEIYLFRGTIADNIRYAKPDATMEEVIEAARAANAHDFIMHLPEGYQTIVGNGSRSLSGGERQRISIARALLLSPSLLILDEATAAMDTQTERQISSAIDRLIVGKTTITIAHRLSTLKNCNRIMAIENGELAEEGTPEELLERKGVYYRLFSLQNDQLEKVRTGS